MDMSAVQQPDYLWKETETGGVRFGVPVTFLDGRNESWTWAGRILKWKSWEAVVTMLLNWWGFSLFAWASRLFCYGQPYWHSQKRNFPKKWIWRSMSLSIVMFHCSCGSSASNHAKWELWPARSAQTGCMQRTVVQNSSFMSWNRAA